MNGFLPVRVNVPLDEYRRLNAEATARGITVAERIAQVVTARPKPGGRRPGAGRKSAYTSKAGEEIAACRRFNMSWPEIERRTGISGRTARDWLAKYENEVREQNKRDRAERNPR